MRDHRKLIEAGTNAQIEKLVLNNHKPPLNLATPGYCKTRILQEMGELLKASTPAEMRLEAADIANFCHALIWWCDRNIKQESI